MAELTLDEQIYRVRRGQDGRWEVREEHGKKLLARFDRIDDAMQYAHDIMAEQRRSERLLGERLLARRGDL